MQELRLLVKKMKISKNRGMKVFYWDDVSASRQLFFTEKTGISIGSFDGLHLGHRLLLSTLAKSCAVNHCLPGVFTFERPLPFIKHSDDYQGDISTLAQRLRLFEELGMEFAVISNFNADFARLSGADFLSALAASCNMQILCEGTDFRCGCKGATDAGAIKYWAAARGVRAEFVEPVYYKPDTEEDERISSSYIRTMLLKGFFSTVQELLARPYELDFSALKTLASKKITVQGADLVLNAPSECLTQVLPPRGIYHTRDEKGTPLRLEVTGSSLVIHNAVELPSSLSF